MTQNVSGWLPNLIGPVVVQKDGVAQTARGALNFVGFEVEDNEAYDRTDIKAKAVLPSVAIAAYAIDWSLGDVFYKTLDAGAQVFTFANAVDGDLIIVEVTGASSSLTWPTVKWPGGTPPTQTTSGTDIYTFVMRGSTIYGSVQQAMA